MLRLANVSDLDALGLPPAALEECKRQLGTKPKTTLCPNCGAVICDCLLNDRKFLATAVGKKLSELGGKARGLPTHKGAEFDCFDSPPAVVAALIHDYGPPSLDAAASPGHAIAGRYYTTEQDAIKQPWAVDCNGGWIFVNPPFDFDALPVFVQKAYKESTLGATVVCLLPFYKSYDWFRNLIWAYAELRMIQGRVDYQGFGPQADKVAGNSGARPFDSCLAIFRPKQRAFMGPYLDPIKGKPR